MKKLHKHIAELAMIQAIPLTAVDVVPQGRIKGLLNRLSKQSQKALNSLPDISQREYAGIIERIARWGELTWRDKNPHAVSMASFALGMIEHSDFNYPPRLIETLEDITDYFDRAGKAMGICFYSGSVAADKWNLIMDGEI